MTLFEMGDSAEITAIQNEYLQLAREKLGPASSRSSRTDEDRDIFEFLGFE